LTAPDPERDETSAESWSISDVLLVLMWIGIAGFALYGVATAIHWIS
jgi:hypothetical protein